MVSSHPLHFLFDLILARTRVKWMRNRIYQIGMSILLFQKERILCSNHHLWQIKRWFHPKRKSWNVITVAAAKKRTGPTGLWPTLSILSKSSLGSTQLMSWKQTIRNGKAKDEDHNATDGDLYIAQFQKLLSNGQSKRLPGSSQSDLRRYPRTQLQRKKPVCITVGNWSNQDSEFNHLIGRLIHRAIQIFVSDKDLK